MPATIAQGVNETKDASIIIVKSSRRGSVESSSQSCAALCNEGSNRKQIVAPGTHH